MHVQQLTKYRKPQESPADAKLLWQQFIEARATAMQTLQIGDSIRAGHAWADFLAAFVDAPSITLE